MTLQTCKKPARARAPSTPIIRVQRPAAAPARERVNTPGFKGNFMATPIDVVIMAAGKGTRMKSSLPKVLHRLGGKALLAHVIECAASVSARKAVVITGHGAETVESACTRFTQTAIPSDSKLGLEFARQEPQL